MAATLSCTSSPLFSERTVASRSSAASSPKSSSAGGRSSTVRRRTSPSADATSSRSWTSGSSPTCFSSVFSPSRIEASAWPGLVVQLAREPRALELLALEQRPHRLAPDPLRQLDRERCSVRERLGDAEVGCRRSADPRPACRRRRRHRSPCRGRPAARTAPPSPRPCAGRSGRPRGRRSARRPARCAAASSARPLFEPGRVEPEAEQLRGVLARGHLDDEALAVRRRALDQHDAGVEQLPEPHRREVEELRELDLGQQRLRDLVERLELPRPTPRRLVEPRVLDRDCGLRGEQADDLLVLVAELGPPLPSRSGTGSRRPSRAAGSGRRGTTASADGPAGSRPSAGPGRCRVRRSGCRSRISTPRIPRPRGRSPIAARVSLSMPTVMNCSSPVPDRIDHAERAVAGPGELRGRLDQLLEQGLERQLGAEGDAGLDEDAQPVGRGDRGLSSDATNHSKARGA